MFSFFLLVNLVFYELMRGINDEIIKKNDLLGVIFK